MRISRSLRLTTLWRSARAEDLHCFPVVTWLKLDPGASQKSVEMDPNLTCEAEWEKDTSTEFERQMGHSAMAQETSRNWMTPYLSYLGRNPTLNASSYAIVLCTSIMFHIHISVAIGQRNAVRKWPNWRCSAPSWMPHWVWSVRAQERFKKRRTFEPIHRCAPKKLGKVLV